MDCHERDMASLDAPPPYSRVRHANLAGVLAVTVISLGGVGVILLSSTSPPATANLQAVPSTTAVQHGGTAAVLGNGSNSSKIEIYLGNGCFWERQWAYYVVETSASGPFAREPADFTSKVGYAGGQAPPAGSGVCYHTGDARDYATLGHAEVTRVVLDAATSHTQMRALAADFFSSFNGAAGDRERPDPFDAGSPYRSVVGLPGGMHSPLYSVFAAANDARYAMQLKPGFATSGGNADVRNVVWVYDSAAFPFFDGEVYHQNHCNFFASPGMPYPDDYTIQTWNEKRDSGAYRPTGCPEVPAAQRSCTSGFRGR